MIFDLENARAGYVIAAYGITAVGLLALLGASLLSAKRRQGELERLRGKSAGNGS